MKVLITGYTYTRENLFRVFESYPHKNDLYFILPSNWRAKGGKVRFPVFRKEGFNIWHSPAFFFHSNYPLIGGLLKGWMPFIVFRVIWLRVTRGINILFTTGEPNLLSTLFNAVLARSLGMKHIFHYWENIAYEEKDKGLKLKLKKMIISANIYLSHGAICGMTKAEEILRGLDKNNHLKIGTFLHAGFDVEKFKPGLEPKLRKELLLGNKTVFLFVGALGYRKGIHLALEAMAELKKDYDICFVIVGSGEYEETLKALVRKLDLESIVRFIPWMANEELPYVYNSADIFLYPSIAHAGWEEQFGYSIAEASLCEIPVISTKSGSIYEVLKENKTGLLIEPNNKDALRAAMEQLIKDRSLRKELGREGRSFIISKFDNRIIAKKMETLFRQVVS